jgi:hypothetical protein
MTLLEIVVDSTLSFLEAKFNFPVLDKVRK